MIENDSDIIIIDAGPDFRQQMLENPVKNISGILLTHEHYDHTGGLDDVRPFGNVNIFAEKHVLDIVKRNMPYCFGENRYPGTPKLQLNEISTTKFQAGHTTIQPVRVMHAKLPILGFRIANIAYLTDVKTISEESIKQLQGLDVLILNALRQAEHIAHLNLHEAIDLARRINAKKTFFTHLSHDMGKHEIVSLNLPENFYLSYDGLVISA